MQFVTRKRRPAPGVMIVSLIDIMMVLLIFLMITSTFKKQPAIKLTLPESSEAKPGGSEERLVVTVSTNAPFFYIDDMGMSEEELAARLAEAIAENPDAKLAIRPDTEAAVGRLVNVMDAAKAAKFKPDAVQMLIRKKAEE